MIGRGAVALLLALSVTACAGFIPASPERASNASLPEETALPPAPRQDYEYDRNPNRNLQEPVASGENARGSGVRSGPDIGSLNIPASAASRAMHAFHISCPSVINREDRSGLTAPHDWVEPCRSVASWNSDNARAFFTTHFSAVEVGDGQAFATGYYEPEIAASRERRGAYQYPIYAVPDDLQTTPAVRNATGALPVFRMVDGEQRPYFDRAEIENGALEGRGLEIAWASDPVALFFFHVQGGGLLRMPDGSMMRLAYAQNNGFTYTSIGGLMRERGLLEPGQTTSQGIQQWLRENPEEARGIMQENQRYIFYAVVERPAATGSLGRYVTARATVAADPAYVPLGAPIYLDVAHDIADGLWVAQDTGGAIQGANRFDTFWGAGEEAHRIAGGMASRGQAYILIPNAAAARLRADR